ncbi:MAG: hypothetical protein WBO06_08515 [Gammaproteobacteria bacterium]
MVKQFINRAEAIAWMSLVMMSDASRRNTLRYCALRDYHAVISVWIVSK